MIPLQGSHQAENSQFWMTRQAANFLNVLKRHLARWLTGDGRLVIETCMPFDGPAFQNVVKRVSGGLHRRADRRNRSPFRVKLDHRSAVLITIGGSGSHKHDGPFTVVAMEKEIQTRCVHEQRCGERERLANKPSQPLRTTSSLPQGGH